MTDNFDDDDEILELPLGRDEWFEIRITITDDGIRSSGDFFWTNVDDLAKEILNAIPEDKREEYKSTAGLVATCFIAASHDRDITQEVHDKLCRNEEAWQECWDIGKHMDHYKPASNSGFQLEIGDPSVVFYRASKERP